MYGNHSEQRNPKTSFSIDLGGLDKEMEGKHRPGHFQGVCTVVKKLFELIELNHFHGRENLAIKRFKKIIDSSSISREDLNFLYKVFQKIEFKIKNETHR